MSALDTITELKAAFYRAVGSVSSDDALVEQGEAIDDVAYLYLTRGVRAAQRWLIDTGLGHRWRKRSGAITSWDGTESADGGRYVELSTTASDFLRLVQLRVRGQRQECGGLVEADGTPWGREIPDTEDYRQGHFYYLKGNRVWITRSASPPATLYLQFYYRHPALSAATTLFDLPEDAMHLGLWEAVDAARAESWFPLGPDSDAKIQQALAKARTEARSTARQTGAPRQWGRPTRYGTRW
jgi:hypothetical protein